jgi:uncharacterized protein YggU (UPF0235/DUF167 family)
LGHKLTPLAYASFQLIGFRMMATQPILIQVKVKPNSRLSALEQSADGGWFAQIKAAPIDGKANEELIALVANRFNCRKSAVSIKSGASGRLKLVRIELT